jgi:hypothetical protein
LSLERVGMGVYAMGEEEREYVHNNIVDRCVQGRKVSQESQFRAKSTTRRQITSLRSV